MSPLSPPEYVLVGPTASGKSDVAHEIAGRTGTGIISADAMMVYRGMDVGTAKPTSAEQQVHVYAGIDLTTPDRSFSVYDYIASVDQQRVSARTGTRWIVVGGTGLYVRCLLKGLDSRQGADPKLRQAAEAVLAGQGFEELKVWCEENLPGISSALPVGDRGNPRRWIRAMERGIGGTDAEPVKPKLPAHIRVVGLNWPRADLEKRIMARVDRMYDGGLLDEVVQLRRYYAILSPTAEKAIGYAEAMAVLDGKLSLNEAKQITTIRTRQYAKRQMTWFRHQLPTLWIDVTENDRVGDIARSVESAWNAHG